MSLSGIGTAHQYFTFIPLNFLNDLLHGVHHCFIFQNVGFYFRFPYAGLSDQLNVFIKKFKLIASQTFEHVQQLGSFGVDAILVGETLMKDPKPGHGLLKLMGRDEESQERRAEEAEHTRRFGDGDVRRGGTLQD